MAEPLEDAAAALLLVLLPGSRGRGRGGDCGRCGSSPGRRPRLPLRAAAARIVRLARRRVRSVAAAHRRFGRPAQNENKKFFSELFRFSEFIDFISFQFKRCSLFFLNFSSPYEGDRVAARLK